MKIAIISRSGPCFPNIISQGLSNILNDKKIENKIFYDGIPFLMRLLPLNKKPNRWSNNLHFRIRNKLKNYFKDKKFIKELNSYDAIILSECYPNAFWKNYFAIEELKNIYKGKIISYTESPLDAAPLNKFRHINADDNSESIYDFNLFVTNIMELKYGVNNQQAVLGVNISYNLSLKPNPKNEFIAVVDFAQPGYELYREQQISTLKKIGIKTIVLEGRYPIEEIREIYSKASIFFLAFPETFGLPIAECLACGTYIFTPNSGWPMAWRLDETPMPMGNGILPDCFKVYNGLADLEEILVELKNNYNPVETPQKVFSVFKQYYNHFFEGDKKAIDLIIKGISKNTK